MSRTFVVVTLLLLGAGLAGCPTGGGGPKLSVYPTAFDFKTQSTTSTFQLFNKGTGELNWEIGSMPSWIHVDPSGTGVTTTELTTFTVTVDRTGLGNGSHVGEFMITSNGGSQLVTVALTVVPIPKLDVDLTGINFGSTSTFEFEVCNPGTGELDWTIDGPEWLTIEPDSGSLDPDECATVALTVDRTGMAPGLVEDVLTIDSNGGNAEIPISMEVPPVTVSPAILNFGRTLSTSNVTISNGGTQDFDFSIVDNFPAWIASVSPMTGTIPAGGQTVVTVQANRAALQPGVFTAVLTVLSAGGNGEVRLRIEGPQPQLSVTPTSLEFFDADFNDAGIASGVVNVRNAGDGTLAWSIVDNFPAWLDVSPVSGTVATGFAPVTVSVDRTLITPNADENATAEITIRSVVAGTLQTSVVTVSARVLPPTLTATPTTLDFGTRQSEKLLAIWNSGVGEVHWNIETAGFPGWLSLSPSSGVAMGAETDAVNVVVDRTGFDPLEGGYSHTFQVTGTDGDGNPLKTINVRASMNVAEVPTITIDTGVNVDGEPNVDEFGVPFLPFGTRTTTLTFEVGNVGTGMLNWSIDTTQLPSWVVSVTPSQDSLEPGEEVTVTVVISRADLAFGSVNHTLVLESNDPDNREQPVRLEAQVPKRVSIGARPTQLAFGLFDLTGFIEVANFGDPGSVLNFLIESNKPWLFFYPETGTSIGTALEFKDWRPINVSIDRSALDGTGSVGELTIRAFETAEDGTRVFLEDVPPVVVRVSVEAAELTFETAEARTRIPSLIRYIMTMRDIRYQSIPLAPEIIEDYTGNFSIFQNEVLVEATETEQFLKSGTGSSGANLKTNVVIMLDYSGSMVDAMKNLDDPLFGGISDPVERLQEAYERTVSRLLEELPPHYRIALMEFHDRGQRTRMVRGLDLNSDGLIDPTEVPAVPADTLEEFFATRTDFTTHRPTLLARLRSISNFIEDHGSSDVLIAAQDAAQRIVYEDTLYDRHPFDDADVRVIIFISDGRLTTPPGEIEDFIDLLADMKVRFLPIGWGQNVNHEPLARLAAGTGGHYYATRGKPSDTIVDTFGRAVRVPVYSELLDHTSTDDVAVDPCDQSVAKDLKSQVVLSFVSLNEERGVKTRIEAGFDNPNDDNGACLPDQGLITGYFEQEINNDEIVGDVRLGQISMRTDGNATGSADVRVRLEYAPRNINKFEFTLEATEPFTVSKIPFADGGIIADWVADPGNPVGPVTMGTYRFDAPAGTVLRYADFGDMINVHFASAVVAFPLHLTVNNAIYNTDIEPKQFIYPDGITVRLGESFASAFPQPNVTLPGDTEPFTIVNLGTTELSQDIEVRNTGGNYPYPADVFLDCVLHWTANVGTNLQINPIEGRLNTTNDTLTSGVLDGLDVVTVTPERNLLAPGPYSSLLIFTYDTPCFELRNLVFPSRTISVQWRVSEAAIGVESADFTNPNVPAPELNFGDGIGGITQLGFTVVNEGQSSFNWKINTDALPAWVVSVEPSVGVAPAGVEGANDVVVTVDRSLLPLGAIPPINQVLVITGTNSFTGTVLPEKSVVLTIEP